MKILDDIPKDVLIKGLFSVGYSKVGCFTKTYSVTCSILALITSGIA